MQPFLCERALSLLDSDMTDVRDIQQAVRNASASGQALRIVGAGTWLIAKRPVSVSAQLSMLSHSGIIDYVPGDLTITVRESLLPEITEMPNLEGPCAEYNIGLFIVVV